jgi:hypothetical protein
MAKKRTPRRAQSTTYLPDHLYSVVFTAARLTDLEPIHSISGVDVGCRHAGIRRDKSGVHLGALVSGRVLASLVAEGRPRGAKRHVADPVERSGHESRDGDAQWDRPVASRLLQRGMQ